MTGYERLAAEAGNFMPKAKFTLNGKTLTP